MGTALNENSRVRFSSLFAISFAVFYGLGILFLSQTPEFDSPDSPSFLLFAFSFAIFCGLGNMLAYIKFKMEKTFIELSKNLANIT
jgi:hypothetical protein